jgi:hypothetical protein
MAVDGLLADLKGQCAKRPVDQVGILRAVEGVLGFLAQPENNTDANCKRADLFVTLKVNEVLPIQGPDTPDDLGRILHDMMLLHDTHTAPHVARNFQTTPDALLARTRQLLTKLTS